MSRILPILFNTEMTKAVLREPPNNKTVTRRDPFQFVMKDGYNPDWSGYSLGEYYTGRIETGACLYSRGAGGTWGVRSNVVKPRYLPGDILYVRETAMIQSMKAVGNKVKMLFAADEALVEFSVSDAEYKRLSKWAHLQRFLSPYWLTKETARTWIRITDTRAERMRDMTIEDMIREGIDTTGIITTSGPINYRVVNRFEELWDSTVKEDWQKFASNPWVWVYEFERCEKPD